ncbi:MAG: hypothetical protein M9894_34785 [Planctomycetes bacterium]|nr:hypothetical protein [Planctomycetota bacterium]
MRVDLAILTPLKAEAEPFLRLLGAPDGPPVPLAAPALVRPFRVGRRRVLAGWTGIGGDATRRAIDALAADPPRALLHAGVAGALAATLRAGDVVVCERLVRDGAGEALACPPGGPLGDWLVGHPRAAAVTVERVVSTAAEKRALFERTGAAVVEMESYWAAQAALAQDLPAACLRVVCDAYDESLPDLTSALDPVGRPRTLRLLRQLVANPGTITALPRVARTFGAAQAALARAVEGVLREVGRGS